MRIIATLIALVIVGSTGFGADPVRSRRIYSKQTSQPVDSRSVPLITDSFTGTVCTDASSRISDGVFTAIVGPNQWIKDGGSGVQWTRSGPSSVKVWNRGNDIVWPGSSACGSTYGVDYIFNTQIYMTATLSQVQSGFVAYGRTQPAGGVFDGTYGGFVWRYYDTNNFICMFPSYLEYGGIGHAYTKVVGGVVTTLISVVPTFNSPATYDIKQTAAFSVGTTHYFWRNGALIGTPVTIADASLQTGKSININGNTGTSDYLTWAGYYMGFGSDLSLSGFTNSFLLQPPP